MSEERVTGSNFNHYVVTTQDRNKTEKQCVECRQARWAFGQREETTERSAQRRGLLMSRTYETIAGCGVNTTTTGSEPVGFHNDNSCK